jgi:LytS/YehU family sensor histidine kinase
MGALAIAIGIAGSLALWLAQRELGVAVLGGAGGGAAIAAQIGAFDGLVALGLWALTILIPFADARAREADELRAEAELARLRASLQPHFLLNTLNAIAGLVDEDPALARTLVGALGDLMRDGFEDARATQTIDDEIAWLRAYADILEIRHRGHLAFRWDIAEAARALRIPRLLLQPLVENAVTHGALRRRDGGVVSIQARVERDRVTCVVEDNGPGVPSGDRRAGARGLELVTRRLALEYDGDATFRLESEGGGTRSIVELPAEVAR